MMSAVVGQDWRNKTYRELWIQYQTVLLETWDHTVTLLSAWSSKKTDHISLHPYRKASSTHSASIVVPTRSIMQIEEYRDGERISVLRQMVYDDAQATEEKIFPGERKDPC